MNCSRCWSGISATMQDCGPFRLIRDPGHWGASDPHTLVLGISKGNTQSTAFSSGPFERVAFKGMRHRVLEVLQAVGLLPNETAPGIRAAVRAVGTRLRFRKRGKVFPYRNGPEEGYPYRRQSQRPARLPVWKSGQAFRRQLR